MQKNVHTEKIHNKKEHKELIANAVNNPFKKAILDGWRTLYWIWLGMGGDTSPSIPNPLDWLWVWWGRDSDQNINSSRMTSIWSNDPSKYAEKIAKSSIFKRYFHHHMLWNTRPGTWKKIVCLTCLTSVFVLSPSKRWGEQKLSQLTVNTSMWCKMTLSQLTFNS